VENKAEALKTAKGEGVTAAAESGSRVWRLSIFSVVLLFSVLKSIDIFIDALLNDAIIIIRDGSPISAASNS